MVRVDMTVRVWKWDETVRNETPVYDNDGNILEVLVDFGAWVQVTSGTDGDVVVAITGEDILNDADADAKDKDLSVELSPVLRPGYHVVTQEIKITEPNEVGEAGDHPVKTRYSNLFSVIRGDCNEDGEIDPPVKMIPIQRVK